jgi:hypothetical protein
MQQKFFEEPGELHPDNVGEEHISQIQERNFILL